MNEETPVRVAGVSVSGGVCGGDSVRETSVTTGDGTRLWAAVSGSGPLLMLSHGGPGYWDTLGPVAAMLDDAFTVVRWDQRGCGRSSGEGGPFSIEQSVADLDAVRAHFGAERLVLGGHSWGASLALLYSLAHPERVESLLYLCGTGLEWAHGPRQAYGVERDARLGDDLARVTALDDRPRTPAEERELRLLMDATNYADRRRARALAEAHLDERFAINWTANTVTHTEAKALDPAAFASRCAGLDLPVLVMQGAGDPRPLDACDSLVAALPQATRAVIADAGHEPWHEAPDAMRDALRGFLGLSART